MVDLTEQDFLALARAGRWLDRAWPDHAVYAIGNSPAWIAQAAAEFREGHGRPPVTLLPFSGKIARLQGLGEDDYRYTVLPRPWLEGAAAEYRDEMRARGLFDIESVCDDFEKTGRKSLFFECSARPAEGLASFLWVALKGAREAGLEERFLAAIDILDFSAVRSRDSGMVIADEQDLFRAFCRVRQMDEHLAGVVETLNLDLSAPRLVEKRPLDPHARRLRQPETGLQGQLPELKDRLMDAVFSVLQDEATQQRRLPPPSSTFEP